MKLKFSIISKIKGLFNRPFRHETRKIKNPALWLKSPEGRKTVEKLNSGRNHQK
jgi:hypothetical protein